eukprot:6209390-Pleurochrysis_carterae.AAC.5
MHGFPFCTRAACVHAERSALRCLSSGWPTRAWPALPDAPPTWSHPHRCAQPPRLRSLPDRGCPRRRASSYSEPKPRTFALVARLVGLGRYEY